MGIQFGNIKIGQINGQGKRGKILRVACILFDKMFKREVELLCESVRLFQRFFKLIMGNMVILYFTNNIFNRRSFNLAENKI